MERKRRTCGADRLDIKYGYTLGSSFLQASHTMIAATTGTQFSAVKEVNWINNHPLQRGATQANRLVRFAYIYVNKSLVWASPACDARVLWSRADFESLLTGYRYGVDKNSLRILLSEVGRMPVWVVDSLTSPHSERGRLFRFRKPLRFDCYENRDAIWTWDDENTPDAWMRAATRIANRTDTLEESEYLGA